MQKPTHAELLMTLDAVTKIADEAIAHLLGDPHRPDVIEAYSVIQAAKLILREAV